MKILEVSASGRRADSVSRMLSNELIEALETREGAVEIVRRDLSQGIPLVDGVEVIRGHGEYFFDSVHLNPNGYTAVAQAVAPSMAKRTVTSRFSPPSSTSPLISSSAMSWETTLLKTDRYRSLMRRPRVMSLNAVASVPSSSRESTETSAS